MYIKPVTVNVTNIYIIPEAEFESRCSHLNFR